ncbi:reverse transcriptase [Purpureocillium lavendulum]|uniref:Reverse transcriptase n=1 Tax=Purpureocillium lavendulum TaxID=1247861 RepID=A0AB34FGI0_9HYPO|nr:reverse transcriptase [Purpureocillium lavendulum]
MAKPVPLERLRRRRKLVTCPACGKTAETIRIRERYRTIDIVMLIYASILLFPLYEHFRGPGGAWVAQYCSSCGIRLVVYISLPRRHYIHATDASVQDLPTDEVHAPQCADRGQQRLGRSEGRTVPYSASPLGPPEPIDEAAIVNYTRRYQHLQSTTTLQVGLDASNGLPNAVWDVAGRQRLYRIERRNSYDPDGAFHARFLWKDKHTVAELLPSRQWAFSNANISVFGTRSGRCVGAGQLAQQSWDTVLFLPRNPSSASEAPHGKDAAYRMHNCRIGHDRQVFSRLCPQFFVPAPRGSTLLWTVRRIVTADEAKAKPTPLLVLLDGYDRLVAANDGAWTTKENSGAQRPRNMLRIYAPADDDLVDAVVVSYAVLCAQLLRRIQWNDISSDETSPS